MWYNGAMEKEKRSTLETAAILAAIFAVAWTIRGDIAANGAAIAANGAAISANTAATAKLEGALLTHVGGHSHAPVIVADNSDAETQ